MIVTTKTGDQGTTGIQGERISKADPLIEVLGDLDELSAECLLLASGFARYRKPMEQIVNQISAASAKLAGYGARIWKVIPGSWKRKFIRGSQRLVNSGFIIQSTIPKARC